MWLYFCSSIYTFIKHSVKINSLTFLTSSEMYTQFTADVLKLNSKLEGSLEVQLVLWQNQKCTFNSHREDQIEFSLYILVSVLFPMSSWILILINAIFSLTEKITLHPETFFFAVHLICQHLSAVCLFVHLSFYPFMNALPGHLQSRRGSNLSTKIHEQTVSFVHRICQMQLTSQFLVHRKVIPVQNIQSNRNFFCNMCLPLLTQNHPIYVKQ